MKKLLCVIFIAVLASAYVHAEEAITIGDGNMRFSYPIYFGFETEQPADGDKIMAFGWGLGFEYGIDTWLDFQLLWDPGVWGVAEGNYAPFSDLLLGIKTSVLGPDALASSEGKFRIASALGINVPLYGILVPEESEIGSSQTLWGSVLRLYVDFMPIKYFYFNLYAEGIFYPVQRSNNRTFAKGEQTSPSGAVKHWLDITGELGPHFEAPIKGKGITLKGGASARIFYAPWLNAADTNATNQWRLSVGGYFGVFFTKHTAPAELMVSYSAPIQGRNVGTVHRVGLTAKIYKK